MNTPKGYSLSQIRLHWVVAALIVTQYLFKDAIGQVWDTYIKGSETTFDPLVLGHVLAGVLILMPLSGALAWFGDVELGVIAHNILKLPLMVLVVLHVLAGLFHQFVLKTNLTARMKTAEE